MKNIATVIIFLLLSACADTHNEAITTFKNSPEGKALFECGGLKSQYDYKIYQSGQFVGKKERLNNLWVIEVKMKKLFSDSQSGEMKMIYSYNKDSKLIKWDNVIFENPDLSDDNAMLAKFCDGKPPFRIENPKTYNARLTGNLKSEVSHKWSSASSDDLIEYSIDEGGANKFLIICPKNEPAKVRVFINGRLPDKSMNENLVIFIDGISMDADHENIDCRACASAFEYFYEKLREAKEITATFSDKIKRNFSVEGLRITLPEFDKSGCKTSF